MMVMNIPDDDNDDDNYDNVNDDDNNNNNVYHFEFWSQLFTKHSHLYVGSKTSNTI